MSHPSNHLTNQNKPTWFNLFLSTLLVLVLILIPCSAQALQFWTMVNTDGFGDANNNSVQSFATYNNKLYAGTNKTSGGAEVWQYDGSSWTQVNTDGFGDANNNSVQSFATYNNKLYAGAGKNSGGAEVWQYDGSSWTQVNTDGFGDVHNTKIQSLSTYNNKLYGGTFRDLGGAEVWEYDGSSWEQTNTEGFGEANNIRVNSLSVYNNNLYAGTYNTSGAEVWEFNGSSWTQVNTDGFGDTNNSAINSLSVYNNNLYAGTSNTVSGAEVWAYDGSSWTQVNTDGFGGVDQSVNSLLTYNNKLYAGIAWVKLWEYDGSSWTQINTDGLSVTMPALATYNHKLYAGTGKFLGSGTAGVWASYALADLKLTISGPSQAASSENPTFYLTVVNNGPDSAGNLVITINLPEGIEYFGCSGDGWTCTSGSLVCRKSELSSGASSILALNLKPLVGGDFTLLAQLGYDGVVSILDDASFSFSFKVASLPETGMDFIDYVNSLLL